MSAFLGRFPGLDPATGMLSLPLWVGGAAAALLVVLCLLAFSRAGREGAIGGLARIALVFIGAGVTLIFFDGSAKRDLAAERRALDARALELLTRAALPGSALACLDGSAGDTVETSCEKALFVTPETTAAAVSYVSAQLALLDDFRDHTRRARTGEPVALVNLRRAAEADRFGLVAQVLAVRDNCTPSDCQTLALFNDAGRISSNLAERTYDFYVVRYAAGWPAIAKPPVASMTSPGGTTTAGRAPGGNVFFPSSASIPPVNIMNSEPPLPTPDPPSAGAPAAKQPPTPPRRPAPAAQARPPVDLSAGRAPPPALSTQ